MKLLQILNEVLFLPTDLNKIIVEFVEDHLFKVGRKYYDIYNDGLLSSHRLFKIVDRTNNNIFIRAYIKNGELGLKKKRNIILLNDVESIVFNYKPFFANNLLPNLQISL